MDIIVKFQMTQPISVTTFAPDDASRGDQAVIAEDLARRFAEALGGEIVPFTVQVEELP